jgi:hypothetical protein
MNFRLAVFVLAASLLLGCPKKEEAAPPAPPPKQEVHAAKPVEAPAPVAAAVAAPAPAAVPAPAAAAAEKTDASTALAGSGDAEVEFFGNFSTGGLADVKESFFVAQAEPCLPLVKEPKIYGSVRQNVDKLFAEFFIPQGSKGHLCAYGADAKGNVIATATYEKNPVTFQGEGEVIFSDVNLKLVALPKPELMPHNVGK